MSNLNNLFKIGNLVKVKDLGGVHISHVSFANWEYYKNNGVLQATKNRFPLKNNDHCLILDNSFSIEGKKDYFDYDVKLYVNELEKPLFLFHFRCQAGIVINTKYLTCLT